MTKTKSGKARALPINDVLLAELRRLPRGLGAAYVFLNPDTGTRYVDLKRAWRAAVARAGLSDFRFHDLRHCFATYVQAGLGDLRVTPDAARPCRRPDDRPVLPTSPMPGSGRLAALTTATAEPAVSGSGTQSGTGA